MGGALKSAEQWKQYWRDFKRNVKAKAAEEKRQTEASGINGSRKIKSLDDFERRAVTIMTVDVIDGDGVSQEKGFCNLTTVSYQGILNESSSVPIPIEAAIEEIREEIPGRSRRRGATQRLGERRRRTENDELNQFLELEKAKIKLKRETLEFQKQMEREKLEIKKKKADALTSISQSLSDLKQLIQLHYN